MIAHMRQILLLSLLVVILSARDVTSNEHQQWNPRILQRRSAEHDNEYVWFTRNVPEEMDDEPNRIDQYHQRKPMHWKFPHRQYQLHVDSLFKQPSKNQETND